MNKPTIYLLSVGIDRYHSDKISNLNEGVNDILKFKKTLIRLGKISESNCKSICNEAATRKEIIKTFRSHFSQLKDGDIALFHFSGHGSWEPTSPEFTTAGYELPGGRNETLVCHDSGYEGGLNIADKELRLLVAEYQQKKPQTTFIGIFDCCHSGSMLREDNLKAKAISNNPNERPLNKYLEGKYSKMLEDTGTISIPPINFISFAACSPKELAFEGSQGGLLTNALIELLNQNQARLSYSELHSLAGILVQNQSNKCQHPYLEYFGESNPFSLFLEHQQSLNIRMPVLHKKGQNWIVRLGAINGIEVPTSKTLNIPIFRRNDLLNSIGKATIKDIFVEETEITPEWHSLTLRKEDNLCIGLYTKSIAIKLSVKRSAIHSYKEIQQLLESSTPGHQIFIHQQAEYEIGAEENKILIYRNRSNKKVLLIGLEENSQLALDWLRLQLRNITKWENTLRLTAPKQSKIQAESISLFFSYWNSKGNKITTLVDTATPNSNRIQQLTIPYDPNKNSIPYQIEVEHHHPHIHGLYFYLIHLDRKYQINQKNEHYTKPILMRARFTLYNSMKKNAGLGISDTRISKVEDTFILVASESPLNSPYSFHQIGFGKNFGKIASLKSFQTTKENSKPSNKLKSNWMIKKFIVQLVRQ